MNVVIDVSGAAEILFNKGKCNIFGRALNEATAVFAPDLYVSELTNTLWKYNIKKTFSFDECLEYIQDGTNLIHSFIDNKTVWQEAFSEGVKNNHSVYDMFYLVTARRYNAVLLTVDSELIKICKKSKIQLY